MTSINVIITGTGKTVGLNAGNKLQNSARSRCLILVISNHDGSEKL